MNNSSHTGNIAISNTEFGLFQKLIFEIAGISISETKKVLLVGRLSRRLKALGCSNFSQYYKLVTSGDCAAERQAMVDLLTTNETYFFREPKHFDYLRQLAERRRKGNSFRAWSAASSSGEEAYTMAMILAETLGSSPWEILGTDISNRVLSKARGGQYPMDRTNGIPINMLKKYCLKGIHEQAGTLLIARELRERVKFEHSNLLQPAKNLGQFDVIFLRNVMIYFESETKRKVIDNLLPYLKSDGHFIVGHSESLNGLTSKLVQVAPTIYRHRDAV